MELEIDELENRKTGLTEFWISGHPDGDFGPYTKKSDALSDKRGIERFEKYKDKPGFITSNTGRFLETDEEYVEAQTRGAKKPAS